MPTNESAGAVGPGAPAPIWQDMLFLRELRDEMGQPSGGDQEWEINSGYKPTPRDPRWLVLLAWAMLVVVVVVFAAIIGPHMGGL